MRDALTREFDALQQGAAAAPPVLSSHMARRSRVRARVRVRARGGAGNRLSREDQQLQGVMKAGVVVGACFNFAAARFVAFPLAMRVPLLAARRPYVRGFA